MNNLELALDHASKGYYVFPAQENNKRPKLGFMDWEANASTDPEDIRKWWSDGNWLPAVAPGRTGHAVIDVDRHPGQPDGFKSLEDENVILRTKVTGTSLSGNGTHFWHKHDIGSLNGVLTSVDRKAKGGYVVVPYILPDQSEITEPLPEKLAGSKTSSNVERKHKSVAELNGWLRTVGAGEPDDEMWKLLETFSSRGNAQMSVHVAKVVSLAAQGHPGGTFILDRMQERWLSVEHSSGDAEEEFQVNIRSAIEKFGEPVPDTSIEDQFYGYLNKEKNVNLHTEDLKMSLEVYCRSIEPNWDTRKNEPRVADTLNKCYMLIGSIQSTQDFETWRTKTKLIMKGVLHGQAHQS